MTKSDLFLTKLTHFLFNRCAAAPAGPCTLSRFSAVLQFLPIHHDIRFQVSVFTTHFHIAMVFFHDPAHIA